MPDHAAFDRIGQISVTVSNLERAVGFYRDTLGLRLLFEAPPRLAFFDCGGVRLMLSMPEPDRPAPGTSIIYYAASNLQAAYERLVARGAGFDERPHLVARMPDHELWMAVCRDTEGNHVGVMSEVRQPDARATNASGVA